MNAGVHPHPPGEAADPILTLSCRSSSRSLMISCRSTAGRRSAGQAVSRVSTRLLHDCSACLLALRLRRMRLRSTTCCRMEFTSWGRDMCDVKSHMPTPPTSPVSSLTSINKGLCPIAAIPCSPLTSATST